jgi:hypothetical protein
MYVRSSADELPGRYLQTGGQSEVDFFSGSSDQALFHRVAGSSCARGDLELTVD